MSDKIEIIRQTPEQMLAEERNYIELFTKTIGTCLREVDQDFVRLIATRESACITPKLTTKFLEVITPLVQRSLRDAISEIVVNRLSASISIPPLTSQVSTRYISGGEIG